MVPHDQALDVIARHRHLTRQKITDEVADNLDRNLLAQLTPLFRAPIQVEPPDVQRVGLGYRAVFPNAGIEMRLSRVHETRYEVHGELTVQFAASAAVFDRHLYQSRFNLSSGSTRTSTAKLLNERLKADWVSMLERFCLAVLELERTGGETEEIGHLETKEPDRWLLQPLLLTRKSTILFGPGGSWKSTLGAAVAVSLTTGQSVIPDWPAQKSTVLVLDWEDDSDVWNTRLRQIAVGAGQLPPMVAYRRMKRPLADALESIAAEVAARKIGALIVDSVGLAIGASHEGEGSADGAFRLFEALRQLGTTNLLIDHVAGVDLRSNDLAAKPYGSVYKENLARNSFQVRRPKEVSGDRAEFILVQSKTNGVRIPPQELAVTHGESTITFARGRVSSPELSSALSLRERIARCLGENGAMRTEDLAQALDVPSSSVRKMVQRDERFVRLSDSRIGLVLTGAH